MVAMIGSETQRAQAQRELARRELARRYFYHFVRYVLPDESVILMDAHHKLICDALQSVYVYIASGGREGIGRWIIQVPPGYWKSLLCSKLFPAWLFGKLPNSQQVLASYSADLAIKNSYEAQSFLKSEQYQAIFGQLATGVEQVDIDRNRRSVRSWQLQSPHRGELRAVGVGGGLTGFRSHYMVWDDLFKDRQQADSENYREQVRRWVTSTALTRLEKNGAVVIIMTRWHTQDVSGWLIAQMAQNENYERWQVLSLPALAVADEPDEAVRKNAALGGVWLNERDPLGRAVNEPLWAIHHDRLALQQIRERDVYEFESLFQQMPANRAGGLFLEAWFGYVDGVDAAQVRAVVMYWDKAATAGGGAYSAGVLMALVGNDYVILSVVRGQWSTFEREEHILEQGRLAMGQWGNLLEVHFEQEPGSAGVDSARIFGGRLAAAGLNVYWAPASGAKITRWRPFAAMAQAGRVKLVRAGWNRNFLDELNNLSEGAKYRDQADAASAAFALLAKNESGFWTLE